MTLIVRLSVPLYEQLFKFKHNNNYESDLIGNVFPIQNL